MSDGPKHEQGPEQARVKSDVALESRVRKHLEILGLPCLAKSLDDPLL
jgi:hypothetical protein